MNKMQQKIDDNCMASTSGTPFPNKEKTSLKKRKEPVGRFRRI